MEYPERIIPREGVTYRNRGGGTYRCVRRVDDGTAAMVREPDGWTFDAHGVRQYRDGTIEWDYSTGGHWPGGKPLAPVTSVAVRRERGK